MQIPSKIYKIDDRKAVEVTTDPKSLLATKSSEKEGATVHGVTPDLELDRVEDEGIGQFFVEFRDIEGVIVGYTLHSKEVYNIRREMKLEGHYYGAYIRNDL